MSDAQFRRAYQLDISSSEVDGFLDLDIKEQLQVGANMRRAMVAALTVP